MRIAVTCVCGSDLWPYRGLQTINGPTPMGHEYCGIVEEVGSAVKLIKPGQFAIGVLATSDNTCAHAYMTLMRVHDTRASACVAGSERGWDLGADTGYSVRRHAPSLLATSDVLGTGWFAADAANVKPESTVAVVAEGGDDGVERIMELTKGVGADSVLECAGTQEAMMQAFHAARPGVYVSYVGVPHGVELSGEALFYEHDTSAAIRPGAQIPAHAYRPCLEAEN